MTRRSPHARSGLSPRSDFWRRGANEGEYDATVAEVGVREARVGLNAESGFVQENRSTELPCWLVLTIDLSDGINRWRRTQNAESRTTNARLF